MVVFNPVTLLLVVVFLVPIIKGIMYKFSSDDLKSDVEGVTDNISFIISLVLALNCCKKIFVEQAPGIYKGIYDAIPSNFRMYIVEKPVVIYIIIAPIVTLLLYLLITLLFNLINSVTIFPILEGIESAISRSSNMIRRVFGGVFQFPKAICNVLIITLIINILSIYVGTEPIDKYLKKSNLYNYVSSRVVNPLINSNIAKQLPNILDNSFKIVSKPKGKSTNSPNSNTGKDNNANTIIYYNGVTLEDGVTSDNEIDKTAVSITEKYGSDRQKSRAIYDWVGSKIDYDYDKANKVLRNDFNVSSGAIPTFKSKSGICFDYSCLYVAMSRAVGLKVRLVTGEGYNGSSWIGHAWNEVYLSEEHKWVNVDTTFYKGGNYFDSLKFKNDHRKANVAGEW